MLGRYGKNADLNKKEVDMNKQARLLLFSGLVSLFFGAWLSYVIREGNTGAWLFTIGQTAAGTFVLVGIAAIIWFFRKPKRRHVIE